ncbi:unnamed protein product [Owenia fusiformis]|uniref:Uncharacterized protein n=1 Tax=Owenia fusiformis TaxID=6347 RepID=A0A8S4NFN3_OWEFU|nr:unnamed protein product [Owenia fusiformis]
MPFVTPYYTQGGTGGGGSYGSSYGGQPYYASQRSYGIPKYDIGGRTVTASTSPGYSKSAGSTYGSSLGTGDYKSQATSYSGGLDRIGSYSGGLDRHGSYSSLDRAYGGSYGSRDRYSSADRGYGGSGSRDTGRYSSLDRYSSRGGSDYGSNYGDSYKTGYASDYGGGSTKSYGSWDRNYPKYSIGTMSTPVSRDPSPASSYGSGSPYSSLSRSSYNSKPRDFNVSSLASYFDKPSYSSSSRDPSSSRASGYSSRDTSSSRYDRSSYDRQPSYGSSYGSNKDSYSRQSSYERPSYSSRTSTSVPSYSRQSSREMAYTSPKSKPPAIVIQPKTSSSSSESSEECSSDSERRAKGQTLTYRTSRGTSPVDFDNGRSRSRKPRSKHKVAKKKTQAIPKSEPEIKFVNGKRVVVEPSVSKTVECSCQTEDDPQSPTRSKQKDTTGDYESDTFYKYYEKYVGSGYHSKPSTASNTYSSGDSRGGRSSTSSTPSYSKYKDRGSTSSQPDSPTKTSWRDQVYGDDARKKTERTQADPAPASVERKTETVEQIDTAEDRRQKRLERRRKQREAEAALNRKESSPPPPPVEDPNRSNRSRPRAEEAQPESRPDSRRDRHLQPETRPDSGKGNQLRDEHPEPQKLQPGQRRQDARRIESEAKRNRRRAEREEAERQEALKRQQQQQLQQQQQEQRRRRKEELEETSRRQRPESDTRRRRKQREIEEAERLANQSRSMENMGPDGAPLTPDTLGMRESIDKVAQWKEQIRREKAQQDQALSPNSPHALKSGVGSMTSYQVRRRAPLQGDLKQKPYQPKNRPMGDNRESYERGPLRIHGQQYETDSEMEGYYEQVPHRAYEPHHRPGDETSEFESDIDVVPEMPQNRHSRAYEPRTARNIDYPDTSDRDSPEPEHHRMSRSSSGSSRHLSDTRPPNYPNEGGNEVPFARDHSPNRDKRYHRRKSSRHGSSDSVFSREGSPHNKDFRKSELNASGERLDNQGTFSPRRKNSGSSSDAFSRDVSPNRLTARQSSHDKLLKAGSQERPGSAGRSRGHHLERGSDTDSSVGFYREESPNVHHEQHHHGDRPKRGQRHPPRTYAGVPEFPTEEEVEQSVRVFSKQRPDGETFYRDGTPDEDEEWASKSRKPRNRPPSPYENAEPKKMSVNERLEQRRLERLKAKEMPKRNVREESPYDNTDKEDLPPLRIVEPQDEYPVQMDFRTKQLHKQQEDQRREEQLKRQYEHQRQLQEEQDRLHEKEKQRQRQIQQERAYQQEQLEYERQRELESLKRLKKSQEEKQRRKLEPQMRHGESLDDIKHARSMEQLNVPQGRMRHAESMSSISTMDDRPRSSKSNLNKGRSVSVTDMLHSDSEDPGSRRKGLISGVCDIDSLLGFTEDDFTDDFTSDDEWYDAYAGTKESVLSPITEDSKRITDEPTPSGPEFISDITRTDGYISHFHDIDELLGDEEEEEEKAKEAEMAKQKEGQKSSDDEFHDAQDILDEEGHVKARTAMKDIDDLLGLQRLDTVDETEEDKNLMDTDTPPEGAEMKVKVTPAAVSHTLLDAPIPPTPDPVLSPNQMSKSPLDAAIQKQAENLSTRMYQSTEQLNKLGTGKGKGTRGRGRGKTRTRSVEALDDLDNLLTTLTSSPSTKRRHQADTFDLFNKDAKEELKSDYEASDVEGSLGRKKKGKSQSQDQLINIDDETPSSEDDEDGFGFLTPATVKKEIKEQHKQYEKDKLKGLVRPSALDLSGATDHDRFAPPPRSPVGVRKTRRHELRAMLLMIQRAKGNIPITDILSLCQKPSLPAIFRLKLEQEHDVDFKGYRSANELLDSMGVDIKRVSISYKQGIDMQNVTVCYSLQSPTVKHQPPNTST